MANTNLKKAKAAKNDEFYTQYADIQNEINAYIDYNPDVFRGKTILLPCDDPEWSNFTKFFVNNFERYGIKKLISTSYAYNSKKVDFDYQPTLFETTDPRFKIETSIARGKIFTLTQDENKDGKIDEKDLRWNYLEGDGDFRSDEIIKLRDEADIIITNPPFSLFREFVAWIFEGKKQFSVIGNMNAITYKEIFPLIIVGVPLNEQELLNAVYSGRFVNLCREEFSNSQNSNVQKWECYINGNVKRQDFLHTALEWVSKGNVSDYMARHRNDGDINEVKKYFTSVIDWIDSTFKTVDSTMRGLEWGRLYEQFHKNSYDINKIDARVQELLADWQVTDKKGVYEFVLSGEALEKKPLLNIRLFDKSMIKSIYTAQTKAAQKNGVSNCPMCAAAGGSNKNRIYKEAEMDADHATAWSKGGATDISNCVMLCKTHNRSKGNR